MKKRLFSWLVIASMMFTMGMIMASADGLTVTSYAVERSVLVFNLSENASGITAVLTEVEGTPVPISETQVEGSKITIKPTEKLDISKKYSIILKNNETEIANYHISFNTIWEDDFSDAEKFKTYVNYDLKDDVNTTENAHSLENGKLAIRYSNNGKAFGKQFPVSSKGFDIVTEMTVSNSNLNSPGALYFLDVMLGDGMSESEDWFRFLAPNPREDNAVVANYRLLNQPSDVNTTYGNAAKSNMDVMYKMTYNGAGTQTDDYFKLEINGSKFVEMYGDYRDFSNYTFAVRAANDSCASVPTYIDDLIIYSINVVDMNNYVPISVIGFDATKEAATFTFNKSVDITSVDVTSNSEFVDVTSKYIGNDVVIKPTEGNFGTDSIYNVNLTVTDGIKESTNSYLVVFDELWNDDFSDAEKFATYGNYDLKDDTNITENAYALENGRLALRYKNNDGKSLYKKFPVSESGFDIITEMKVDGTNNDKSSSYFLDILLDEALSDGSNWMRLLKPGAEDGAVMTNLNVLGSERISSPVGVSAKTQVSNIKYRMKYAGVGDTENDYFSLDINGNKYEYTGDYGKDFKEYAIGLRTNNNDEENPTYIDDLLIYSVEVTDITSALNTAESFRIDGEVKPGDTLTCVNDNPASLPDICQIDYEYKWYKNSENSADFDTWKLLDNSEATDKSVYVVKEDDKDDYIVCIVTPKLTILPTGQEITLLDINTPVVCKKSSPEIKDEKIEYNKDTNSVTASMFYYDFNYDDGATDFVWEVYKDGVWEVVKSTSDVESKFGEKVEDTYVITAENTGKDIRCKMTVKNTADFGYEESTLAARTKNLSLTAPVIKGDVTISGNSSVGSVLSASYEYYDADNDEEDATVWEWYRVGKNEKTPVGNALNYSVSSQDCGYEIVLEITPKSKAYPYDGITYVSDGLKIPETKKPSYGGGSGSSGGGSSVIRVPAPSNSAVNDNVYFKTSFKDISGHWAEKEIKQLEALGLVKGDGEKYNPDAIVKRAEWITMLTRAIGFKEAPYKDCFDDVKSSDWYSGIIQAAFDADLIDGDGSNFNPVNELTREALVKMMIDTYLYKKGVEIPDVTNTGFDDDSDISTWAKKYVSMASELGIMTGVTPTTFAPKKIATRAEAAVVLVRLLDALKN